MNTEENKRYRVSIGEQASPKKCLILDHSYNPPMVVNWNKGYMNLSDARAEAKRLNEEESKIRIKGDPVWFLLFGGESVDGRGPATYVGRTLDPLIAYEFLLEIEKNPYSVGYVCRVTNTYYTRINSYYEFSKRV